MNRVKVIIVLSVVVLAGLIRPALAPAQTASTGALTGTVSDPTGAVVPGVRVEVTNSATGATRTVTTEERGGYRVPLLPPGIYSVKFSASGFQIHVRDEIVVNVAETQTLNIALAVGTVAETVTVEGGTAVIQAETTALGSGVSDLTITSVPLTTRNYTQTLGFSAGVGADVANAGELGRNSQDVFVNGLRATDNNYQMDGAGLNNFGTGRAGGWLAYTGIGIPNPDAIQEFKIQTNLYDAGYGRNAGANVNVVTKSGGNEFHGTLFEFFRNEKLNANDFFQNRLGNPKPVLRQNQFGGSVGGPIIKDKLTFFVSYQRTRQTNGSGSASLQSAVLPPLTGDRSAAALGAQFCLDSSGNPASGTIGGTPIACDGSNINPVALALLNATLDDGTFFIPTPQTITADGLGFSVFSVPSEFTEDQIVANADYSWGGQTLSSRFFFSRDPSIESFTTGPGTVPGSGITKNAKNFHKVLKLTSVLGGSFVNEARGSWTRNFGETASLSPLTVQDLGMTPSAELDIMPAIVVSGLFNLGGTLNDGFKTAITTYSAADTISWSHGTHNIRAGFEYVRTWYNEDDFSPKRGVLTFFSFPDFLLGMNGAQTGTGMGNVGVSVGFAGKLDRQFRLNNYSSFIQDDWKVHPQLTLNLGLRWDINGAISEKDGFYTNFVNRLALAEGDPPPGGSLTGWVVPSNFPDAVPAGVLTTANKTTLGDSAPLHNFGPRIGLAWRPLAGTDRFVVRTGYGIYYSRTTGNGFLQLILTPPYSGLTVGVNDPNLTFQVPFIPVPLGTFPARTPTSSVSTVSIPENTDSPMTQQFNLNLQVEFLPSYVLQVGYVGSRSTRLPQARRQNQPRLASPQNPIRGITVNTVANAAQRVPVLGAGSRSFSVETYGFLWYHSLQASVRKQFSRGLHFEAAYTWSKTLDDSVNTKGFSAIFTGGNYSGDIYDRPSAWGPSEYDRRHRFIVNYVYEFPSFSSGIGFTGKLLTGWQISGVTTFQSGTSLSILDANRAGSIFGLAPRNARATLGPGFTHADIATSGSVDERLDAFFNAAAFSDPPIIGDGFGMGTLGRGVIRGPDQRNFDFSLSKKTTVGGLSEDAHIEFRAEFFNIFNTPQFADPANDFGVTANFGKITATAVTPRLIQFALKYTF